MTKLLLALLVAFLSSACAEGARSRAVGDSVAADSRPVAPSDPQAEAPSGVPVLDSASPAPADEEFREPEAPPSSVALPPELDQLQAFYYPVAIDGPWEGMIDDFGRYFDRANYQRLMADEFERSKYRERLKAMIMEGAGKITFQEEYTYVTDAILQGYSFETKAFPIRLPRTGFKYFNYSVEGNGFTLDPFNWDHIANRSDIDWSLPMSEEQGSALVKTRPYRNLTAAIVYSVDRRLTRYAGRIYLKPVVRSVKFFTDESLVQLLGESPILNTSERKALALAARLPSEPLGRPLECVDHNRTRQYRFTVKTTGVSKELVATRNSDRGPWTTATSPQGEEVWFDELTMRPEYQRGNASAADRTIALKTDRTGSLELYCATDPATYAAADQLKPVFEELERALSAWRERHPKLARW
jgi:Domain of unknown function (DUF4852)